MSSSGMRQSLGWNSNVWPATAFPVRRRRRRRVVERVASVSDALPVYVDSGDANCVCPYCGALFWFNERIVSASRVNRPVYNQCCKGGAVVISLPRTPPLPVLELYGDSHFKQNIRAYNSMFSMTSFGAKVDESVSSGRGPYTFKVSGRVSHWIGSLCPQPNDRPRFLQLYIYDTANEVHNRLEAFSGQTDSRLRPAVVAYLANFLDSANEYVRTFWSVVRIADDHRFEQYSIRLYNDVRDVRYGLPGAGTLGAIVAADDPDATKYDIIVHSKNGRPHRISNLHHSYMPLQYPLLFPYGDVGWSPRLRLRVVGADPPRSLTVNAYYSYLLHNRYGLFSVLLRGGKLFQQFLVDAYLCVEDGRLEFPRKHQNQLRSEFVAGVYDAVSRGDSVGNDIGRRTFLPSTFVGGPRYMYKHYQDALALCRVYGNPQYFITFTCNARWPEIVRFMDSEGGGSSQDRPDIIARLFQMKVVEFINFLKDDLPFGPVSAYLYTIEFQKRGLPHCHTLLWVHSASKIRTPEDVDKYITAELPDPEKERFLYSVVTRCMLHGPCGLLNLTAVCMRDGICKKKFPKPLSNKTFFDKDGYVHYKRGGAVSHTLQSGVTVDNGFVVPYNKRLLTRFDAHINVEYCGWNMVIKYLFKYISKGVERVGFSLRRVEVGGESSSAVAVEPVDEIQNFVDGRFVCPHEAAWRILNFDIHERRPAVQVLAVHLENMQRITFDGSAALQNIIDGKNFGKTTLTRWMVNNRWDSSGRHLTYVEYPSMFRWDASQREWFSRVSDVLPPIGRLAYVHPAVGELFYLRMLLSHQKGSRSFSDLRTVNGVLYESFRLACEALGLVGDDKEWLTAFLEASVWATSSELRSLFVHLVLFCEVGSKIALWEVAWPKMGDDVVRMLQDSGSNSNSVVNDELVKQHILFELEKLFNACTPPKSLVDFKLPLPSPSLLASLRNRLLLEESVYDTSDLQLQHSVMVDKLNAEQLRIYNRIRSDHSLGKQTLLFVYGHGGTGKTFLWSVILAYLRSIGKIVLAVASSGIASLLLPNGRTAHSRFNIPIDLSDNSVCDIKKRTQLAELFEKATMIIWDESTMADRRCFECVDRSLRDVLGQQDKVFGGISVLLGGDFRQTLPVKRKKTHQDVVASTLPNSYLWGHFTVYRLTHNLRLSATSQGTLISSATADFAAWLLDVGNGLVGIPDMVQPQSASLVKIPKEFLIMDEHECVQQLIDFVYTPDILADPTPQSLCTRAIVCPKNDDTDEINTTILQMGPGEMTSYSSTDSITPHIGNRSDIDLLYPQEYLNNLTFPGLPLHTLQLKKNVPIVLLRNMNQKFGMCNGTRLIVTGLMPAVIQAVIMTGTSIGRRVYIPRIKFVHHDPELPFVFNRKQFPCKVCYAMTINKSQGQSLQKIGVYLPLPLFGHGQLYVALSRATSPESIKVLILDEHGKPTDTTKNIVFKNFLAQVDTFDST